MALPPSAWTSTLLLLAALAGSSSARAQAVDGLPARDRIRLAEAMRLVREISGRVWPGWGGTAMPTLLVTQTAEFFFGHSDPGGGFTRMQHHSLLRSDVWTRPRRFSPALLATFPAVGGAPTIVVGSAELTDKPSTDWVLAVLHEHFHQWQYSRPGYHAGVAALDLARADTTGRWMLDYPFPYDSGPVQRATARLAVALVAALDAETGRAAALAEVLEARNMLRASISPADYRYLEFQLWQEGVARYIEYAVARSAATARRPATDFSRLPDYESYGAARDRGVRRLRQELRRLSLGRDRRVSFYPLGAALAMLLEQTRPDWRQVYAERPFALSPLLFTSP